MLKNVVRQILSIHQQKITAVLPQQNFISRRHPNNSLAKKINS